MPCGSPTPTLSRATGRHGSARPRAAEIRSPGSSAPISRWTSPSRCRVRECNRCHADPFLPEHAFPSSADVATEHPAALRPSEFKPGSHFPGGPTIPSPASARHSAPPTQRPSRPEQPEEEDLDEELDLAQVRSILQRSRTLASPTSPSARVSPSRRDHNGSTRPSAISPVQGQPSLREYHSMPVAPVGQLGAKGKLRAGVDAVTAVRKAQHLLGKFRGAD